VTPSQKKQINKRRRAALRHTFFTRVPNQLTGGLLSRVRPGKDFCLNQRTLNINTLPDELCGLTITHLSDLHIGELTTPAHLPHIVKAVNKLNSDLIAITGDFIDFTNDHLPPVIDALQQLRAPLGVFNVLGNHDYLDDADELKHAFKDAKLNLLIDQAVRLQHHNRAIALAGIDWAATPNALTHHVHKTVRKMEDADVSILLAHHPHAFDAAARAGIDLTLSGHTHGGQLVLSATRGIKGSIGLANLAFKYPRGLYKRGESNLFVSSGVGSWFPLRFQCPAEITVLELQNTY